jgi:threonine dehydrogenase-like Zn-dependent dehydrogenase
MRSFVMRGIGQVGYMDKPVPKAGPGDAIVRTTMALICTSDVHTADGAIGERTDLTLGHEAVGIVKEVGSEVRDFKPGDRVVVGAITPDWGDAASQRGHSSQSSGPLGGWKFANSKDGVFAEFFHVNEADANLAHIPSDVRDEQAVYCADMLSTGFGAAEGANIPIGGTVAVFALGPVGLMAVAGARLRGAGLVIGVEGIHHRATLGRTLGADTIVDPADGNVVEQIVSLTGGEGVDSAIEALGSEATFAAAIEATKPGGTICNVGYHGHGDTVGIPRLGWGVGMAEKTIVSVLCPGGRVRMERLLRLIRNERVDPSILTTHVFPFASLEEAFDVMRTKRDGVIKPLIQFAEIALPAATDTGAAAATR